MMWYLILSPGLPLLHSIIQKEINKDGVHFSIGVFLYDFTADQFNAPYAAPCSFLISMASIRSILYFLSATHDKSKE